MPTFVTAGNSAYFKPLEATVFYIHTFFPDAKLIVYDLGLTVEQNNQVICIYIFLITMSICLINCQIRLNSKGCQEMQMWSSYIW